MVNPTPWNPLGLMGNLCMNLCILGGQEVSFTRDSKHLKRPPEICATRSLTLKQLPGKDSLNPLKLLVAWQQLREREKMREGEGRHGEEYFMIRHDSS